MEPLSVDDLVERYSNPDFINALRSLMDLKTVIESCIIRKEFKITQPMYDPVALTQEGQRAVEKLVKRGIPYPQARFLRLLLLLQVDLLVDPLATDVDRLADVASRLIRDGDIMYPFVYGRLLYDRAHDLGLNSKNTLSHKDTLELLTDTPQGVFQVGEFVTGPYGLLRSCARRAAMPSMYVAYHCGDISCNTTHMHHLPTSREAEINESREKAEKIFEKDYPDPSDWARYFRRSRMYPGSPYNDFGCDSIAYLLGDGISIDELRLVVAHLLDNTKGEVREALRRSGETVGPATKFVTPLDSASLIQVCLLASDRSLFATLDSLVLQGQIDIPVAEVRRPVINRRLASGAFSLRPELGRYGLRMQSGRGSLASLRLRRLVRQMYRLDKEEDRLDLAWHLQIRNEASESIESTVERYLQSTKPREAVDTLILARRSNFIVAAEKLMLSEKYLASDEERVDSVLWKLGFSVEDLLDPHKRFWNLHDKMVQLTRQSQNNPSAPDEEQVRSQAVNYFVSLEDILKDSLLYTTWALSNDHFASDRQFVYRPSLDESASLETLRARASLDTDEDGRPRLTIDDKMTLYPLVRGFGLLAEVLADMQSRHDELTRPTVDIPIWIGAQDLERFPLEHTVPFLDLLPDSKATVLGHLRKITSTLIGADVNEARNEWLHPRANVEMDRLRASLDAIRDAIEVMEDNGFSRQVYRRVRTEVDEANRSTVVLADSRGQEVVLFKPSGLAWLGLPRVDESQHIMSCARFAEPTEALRFVTQHDSAYSKIWSGYPTRPRKTVGHGSARSYSIEAATDEIG
jgi:hypothetical protein